MVGPSLFSFVAVALLSLPVEVNGNGFLMSPRSRNWYASEEGVLYGDPEKPLVEYCYQCLHTGGIIEGVCGVTNTLDYTFPISSDGGDLAWTTQATFSQGDTITVESIITTHHKGHFELYLCVDPNNPSMSCFAQFPLKFVRDNLYHAPADTNFTQRGYLAPMDEAIETSSPTDGYLYSMDFELPRDAIGERVLLLWKYMTGNACRYDGYDEYPWPEGWEPSTALGSCEPVPAVSGFPEQFSNCAEIEIVERVPTKAPSPTGNPTSNPTSNPTVEPSSVNGCCSQNFRDCDASWAECGVGQCCGDAIFLQGGADTTPGCIPRWTGGCVESLIGCCSQDKGVTCQNYGGFNQCVHPDVHADLVQTGSPTAAPSVSPTAAPSVSPTAAPSVSPTEKFISDPPSDDSVGCCSSDLKYCHGWGECSEDSSGSDGCCHDTKWIAQGRDMVPCVVRWEKCVDDDDCCGGDDSICVAQTEEGYSMCMHKEEI